MKLKKVNAIINQVCEKQKGTCEVDRTCLFLVFLWNAYGMSQVVMMTSYSNSPVFSRFSFQVPAVVALSK